MASGPPPPSSSAASQRAPARPWGRFELRGLFGRTDFSMAWLAYDPRNAQEVMLLLPRVQPTRQQELAQWHGRVSAASRLQHPSLVGASEIGIENGWPFVVIPRSHGVTLGEWLMSNPPPSFTQAVEWVRDVLIGLGFAHDSGFTHGDIEPYSLWVDAQGKIRLSGMAVASVAPEGANPQPARQVFDEGFLQTKRTGALRDVLNVGLVFHRLLVGQMPLGAADFGMVISQMPPTGPEVVRIARGATMNLSEALRAIANRACSPFENQRYLSAHTFLAALDGWLASQNRSNTGGPLALLMQRIESDGHVPICPDTAQMMDHFLRWESHRNDEIAEKIFQDVALTIEMLRMVNLDRLSADPPRSPLITVRRAVAMVGMSGVRRCVQSLRPWPGRLDALGAAELKKLLDKARLAGEVVQMLAPAGFDPEVLFVVAVMQNLGRLLVQAHFPDEAQYIRDLMQPEPLPAPKGGFVPGLSEEAASFGVLGLDLETLGVEVAKAWGWGEELVYLMRRMPLNRSVHEPNAEMEWFRIAASAANEVVEALDAPTIGPTSPMGVVVQRYQKTLEFDAREALEAVKAAREALRRGELVKTNAYPLTQPMGMVNTGFGDV